MVRVPRTKFPSAATSACASEVRASVLRVVHVPSSVQIFESNYFAGKADSPSLSWTSRNCPFKQMIGLMKSSNAENSAKAPDVMKRASNSDENGLELEIRDVLTTVTGSLMLCG